jgi:hypothetical protein
MGDKGFFMGLFDFDGDGELNSLERALDYTTFVMMTKEDEEEEDDAFSLDDDEADFDESEFDDDF